MKILVRVLFICIYILPMTFVSAQSPERQEGIDKSYVNKTFKAIKNLESVDVTIPEDMPIILDFGTMYCGPCISSLVKMDTLLNSFAGKVAMFMVTREKNADVLKFKTANNRIKNVRVPIITDDTLLHEIFEHQAQPHLVWIDREKSNPISSKPLFLTHENLKRFVNGNPIDVVEKLDRHFDYQKGVFSSMQEKGDLSFSNVMPRRFISGNVEGIQAKRIETVDSVRGVRRHAAYNFPIIKMYAPLFNKTYDVDFFNNQIDCPDYVYEKLVIPNDKKEKLMWAENNTYCYEYECLVDDADCDKHSLLKFLDHYFGFETSLEVVNSKVWFIKPFSVNNKKEKQEGTVALYTFCKMLNNTFKNTFFSFDREDARNCEIEFNEAIFEMDLERLKQFLEAQGFMLVPREMPVEKLVFKTNYSSKLTVSLPSS